MTSVYRSLKSSLRSISVFVWLLRRLSQALPLTSCKPRPLFPGGVGRGVGWYSPIKLTGVLVVLFRGLYLWVGTAKGAKT